MAVPEANVITNLNVGKFGDLTPRNWLIAKKELIDNNPDIVKLVLKEQGKPFIN